MRDASPLRYPGGKWRISSFFERTISLNRLSGCSYVEPYAGGGSLALSLLFSGVVAEVHLNDIDRAIYSFWRSVISYKQEFLSLLDSTPITADEWHRQKSIYNDPSSDTVSLGFATFFLNRTNYSGILNGGMIGGNAQSGNWKLDARFNRQELRNRIERIAKIRTQVHLSCKDALEFITSSGFGKKCLLYLDPPYYRNGRRLYHNHYRYDDHLSVSESIKTVKTPWVVSYDDVPEIRKLYAYVPSRKLNLRHTARSTRLGSEVLFFNPSLRIPRINRQ
jgi:DNA adenine methylase